ncbi:hypothetical protein PHYPSEUDO_002086 [Phytophthora pseudosyringae]|uniref:M96 mating-specific protein family n=1 Tax=Phytophthora pseudosyringae TaxID=221518 RepID=A0A8T1VYH5_9STRA|nr:hypothetical protein PHYPSEUDO_002086 [Phytophthora pseudosyringae]
MDDHESFLADLNGFLHALQASDGPQSAVPASNHTVDLLQDSDHLLAETEALLVSYGDANAVHVQQDRPQNARSDTPKTLEEQRREIQNAQAAKRRLKYRNKLKNERLTLLEQEKVLSDELSHLQRARRKAKAIEERSVAAPLWEAVASRQMDGRRVAEEQQWRLKNAVASRAKMIQEVDEMMRQQLFGVATTKLCAEGDIAATASAVQLDADDTALFEEYLQDMDVVYKQMDEAFRACQIADNVVTSFKVGPEWKRDGDLEYFENVDVSLMPFGFEQTCSTMWQAMLHVHKRKDRQHYRGVSDPENTIAVKCRIPSPTDSGELVGMLVHLVTKRYVEADRSVMVWRALTEGDDEFSGMHSDETGWCVLRPNKADSDGAVVMPTVMQTFARFIPMTVATTFRDKTHVDQFAKLVVTSGEEDAADIARMMASLLIEDSPDKDVEVQTPPVIL